MEDDDIAFAWARVSNMYHPSLKHSPGVLDMIEAWLEDEEMPSGSKDGRHKDEFPGEFLRLRKKWVVYHK